MPDDFENTVSTTGAIETDGIATGVIETVGDVDWFATQLEAGRYYAIDLISTPTADNVGLRDPYFLGLRNAQGDIVYGTEDDDGGEGLNSRVVVSVAQAGTYFLAASGLGDSIGAYEIRLSTYNFTDDFGESAETSGSFSVSDSATGEIQAGDIWEISDVDWFAIELTSGETYLFETSAINGEQSGADFLPAIEGIYDGTGAFIPSQEEYSGYWSDKVLFTPSLSGTYHVAVTSWDIFDGDGHYVLDASVYEHIDDFPATVDTTGTLEVGGVATGELEDSALFAIPDRDWFAVELEAGGIYAFDVWPSDDVYAPSDEFVIDGIYDSEGVLLPNAAGYFDYWGNSQIFAPEEDATYFVSVSSDWYGQAGTYELSAEEVYRVDGNAPERVVFVGVNDYWTDHVDDGLSSLIIGSERDNFFRGIAGTDTLMGEAGDDILIADDSFGSDWWPRLEEAITRLFEFLLDRQPSEKELETGLDNAYYHFSGLTEAAAHIIGSPEFLQRWGRLDGEELISFFYSRLRGDVVDNDPGRENWVNQLDDLQDTLWSPLYAKAEVARSFVMSAEYQAQSSAYDLKVRLEQTENMWEDELFSAYRAVLGRNPDARGFANWLDRLERGLDLTGLAERMLASQEFVKTSSGLPDRDFAKRILENLGTDASEAILDAAVAQLDAGIGRADFVAVQVLLSEDEGLEEWMVAQGEDDVLVGSVGNDLLFGGEGADRFVFAPGDGKDTVVGLQSYDIIDLQAFDFTDASTALAAFRQDGDAVVFEAEDTVVRFRSEDLTGIFEDMLQV